jgi:hypothetical protein
MLTCASNGRNANLERDVLIAQANFKFLSTVLVLLWPLGVVFPVKALDHIFGCIHDVTYFRISLSLMMRLISSIMSELTHTGILSDMPTVGYHLTYSLCGSMSRCGSWSCWHNAPKQSGHHPGRGNQTLEKVSECGKTCIEPK